MSENSEEIDKKKKLIANENSLSSFNNVTSSKAVKYYSISNMNNCKFCGTYVSDQQQVLKHMRECNADILVEYSILHEKLNYLLYEPLNKCYLCGKNCFPEVLCTHWAQCHPRIQAIFKQLVKQTNICNDPDLTYCLICGALCNSLKECGRHISTNHYQYFPFLYHMSLELIASNPQRSKAIKCKLCRNLLINRDPNDKMEEFFLLVFDLLHRFYYQIIFACRKNKNFLTTEETCVCCGEVFLLIDYVAHLSNKHPLTVLMYGQFFDKHIAFIHKKNTCVVCREKLSLDKFTSHLEEKHSQLLVIMSQLSSSLMVEIESKLKGLQYDRKLLEIKFQRNVPAIVDIKIEEHASCSQMDEIQDMESNDWQPMVIIKPLNLEAWAKGSISHTSGTSINWQPVVHIEQFKLDKLISEERNEVFVKKQARSYSKKELLQKKKTSKNIKYSKKRALTYLNKLHNMSPRTFRRHLKSYRLDKNLRNDPSTKLKCDVQYSCSSNANNMDEIEQMIESPKQELFLNKRDVNSEMLIPVTSANNLQVYIDDKVKEARLPPVKSILKHKIYVKKQALCYLREAILYKKRTNLKKIKRSNVIFEKKSSCSSKIQSNVYKSMTLEENDDLRHAICSPKFPENKLASGLINKPEGKVASESNLLSHHKTYPNQESNDKIDATEEENNGLEHAMCYSNLPEIKLGIPGLLNIPEEDKAIEGAVESHHKTNSYQESDDKIDATEVPDNKVVPENCQVLVVKINQCRIKHPKDKVKSARLIPVVDSLKHKIYVKKQAQYYLRKAILYKKKTINFKKFKGSNVFFEKDQNCKSRIQSNVHESMALKENNDLKHAMCSSKLPEIKIIIPGLMNIPKVSHDKIYEELFDDKVESENSQVPVVRMNQRKIKKPSRLIDYVLDYKKMPDVKHQEINVVGRKRICQIEKKIHRKLIEKEVLKCQKRLTKYVTKYEDILAKFKLNLIHARKIIASGSIARIGNTFIKQMDLIADDHVRKNIKKLLKDLIEALKQVPKTKKLKLVEG